MLPQFHLTDLPDSGGHAEVPLRVVRGYPSQGASHVQVPQDDEAARRGQPAELLGQVSARDRSGGHCGGYTGKCGGGRGQEVGRTEEERGHGHAGTDGRCRAGPAAAGSSSRSGPSAAARYVRSHARPRPATRSVHPGPGAGQGGASRGPRSPGSVHGPSPRPDAGRGGGASGGSLFPRLRKRLQGRRRSQGRSLPLHPGGVQGRK
mmetsp:Transcript_52897/g.112377  ORF Transcript_52897/g.112377 Transcript_52897/m.112377 type:complete len:206 (-) Transcript_52897:267-884(-)